MNKKLLVSLVSLVMVLFIVGAIYGYPRLSKEKRDFYLKNEIEINKENDAIGEEMLRIAKMKEGPEKEEALKELAERENKFKRDSTKIAEDMKKDGYVNDEDILDTNLKLVKELEAHQGMKKWDINRGINNSEDKKLIEFETKQLEKIEQLLEKVKKSDDSNFNTLYNEYIKLLESFKTDRAEFELRNKEN
jgi:hypothetical protein